jgi:DNA gyrase inhibitor GyrI
MAAPGFQVRILRRPLSCDACLIVREKKAEAEAAVKGPEIEAGQVGGDTAVFVGWVAAGPYNS